MLINVVTVNSGWILQKIAERIVANCPQGHTMRLNHFPFFGAYNFYVDVQNCYRGPTQGIDIGLFTHVHENSTKHLHDIWFTLDHVIHMSLRNLHMWQSDTRYPGVGKQPCTYKIPGEAPEGFKFKKRRIGVAQRGHFEGKGFYMLMDMAKKYPEYMKEFDWLFIGNDWEPLIQELSKHTEAVGIPDREAKWPDDYARFYSEIDYLLIPSKWEGGPMSMLEAAAAGVPIIAAQVGWVNKEIPVAHSFYPGAIDELEEILYGLSRPQREAYEIVRQLSYKDYSQHVVDCFQEVETRKNARAS